MSLLNVESDLSVVDAPCRLEAVLSKLDERVCALRQIDPECDTALTMEAAANLLGKYESLLLLALSRNADLDSVVGPSIRRGLGMGSLEPMTSGQLVRAKLSSSSRIWSQDCRPSIPST